MHWLKLSAQVTHAQAESTIEAMQALGSQATTQQNAGEDSYFDLAHPAEPGWDVQTVTGLFAENNDPAQLRATLLSQLDFLSNIETSKLEDQDWETAWLEQYKPVKIASNLWVYPSWVEVQEGVGTVIKIDPGMAFGTGTHETTHLCMQALNELELDKLSVLDYGCGSGILAITALKLGAAAATGVDIDPKAELVAQENALNNGVAAQFAIQSPLEIKGRKFDIVVANILAFALVELAPQLIAFSKGNGVILLSGILENQADKVISAYQTHFSFTKRQAGSWLVLIGRKL